MNLFPMSEPIKKSCINYATRFLYGDVRTKVLDIINTTDHSKRDEVLHYLTVIVKAECNLIDCINK